VLADSLVGDTVDEDAPRVDVEPSKRPPLQRERNRPCNRIDVTLRNRRFCTGFVGLKPVEPLFEGLEHFGDVVRKVECQLGHDGQSGTLSSTTIDRSSDAQDGIHTP